MSVYRNRLVPVPEDLAKIWVRLYVEDKLSAADIKKRYPDWGLIRIRTTIRERIGSLETHRTSPTDGWCG